MFPIRKTSKAYLCLFICMYIQSRYILKSLNVLAFLAEFRRTSRIVVQILLTLTRNYKCFIMQQSIPYQTFTKNYGIKNKMVFYTSGLTPVWRTLGSRCKVNKTSFTPYYEKLSSYLRGAQYFTGSNRKLLYLLTHSVH